MNVPDRIAELFPGSLPRVGVEELQVIVDVPRDDIEVQPLGGLGLAIHEQRQALRTGVTQPLIDGQPVALRLGNLLTVLVQEKLVVEAFGRRAAQGAADLAGQLDRIDQILAGHLVVDAERDPAHRPVRLPLQLAVPAGDRRGDAFMIDRVRILIGDGAGRGVVGDDRDLQHDAAARRDRQERRIGLRPLGAQRRQHDRHHRLEALQHVQQRRVETPRRVAGGRRQKLVVEAELVEKGAQPRIVVLGEARIGAERVGHPGQRLAEMGRHHFLVGDVVGHLAQAVHVVGKRDQPGLDRVVGEHAKRVAHHGGARDLAERADMRQAGRPVAGLEDHLVLRLSFQPRHDLARLLERPGVRLPGEFADAGGILDCRGRRHHAVGAMVISIRDLSLTLSNLEPRQSAPAVPHR